VSPTITSTFAPYEVRIKIYNDAGELVRELAPVYLAQPARVLRLSADYFTPDDDGQEDLLMISLDEGDTAVQWDGLNDQGQYVANGNYIIVLESSLAGGAKIIVSGNVKVYKGTIPLLNEVRIRPNPVRDKLYIDYDFGKPVKLRVRVYTLAAELVCSLAGHGAGSLVWDVRENRRRLADGLYILVIEADYNGIVDRRIERVLVVK